jgi:hypothetical protein
MYFTLAVSAATTEACAALAGAAERTDPQVMPIPGLARVAWRAPGGRSVVLHWGDATSPGTSHAGTIWAEGATVHARTGLARVDPVYRVEVPGAVVVSDRACWAAAITGRMGDPDPAMAGAFLSLGYPIGDATPFRGVRALGGDQELRLIDGRMGYVPPGDARPTVVRAAKEDERPAGAEAVSRALTEAVRPLGAHRDPAEAAGGTGRGGRARPAPRGRAGVRRDAVRVREPRVRVPAGPAGGRGAGRDGRPRRRAAARRLRAGRVAHVGRCGRSPERHRRRRTLPPDDHAPPPPAQAGPGAGLPGHPGAGGRGAGPGAASRARRLLPGEPGRPVVGRRPAGVPAAVTADPAAVRGPRGASRTGGPAP